MFEGPCREAPNWGEAFEDALEESGLDVGEMYFFYTTCPRCAQAHGKNYVVAVARLETEEPD